jgi:hypothetical protein
MRTKKILAALLAALSIFSVFAVAGVSAQDSIEPQVAQVGWTKSVEIVSKPELAAGVDQAVVSWDAFTANSNADSTSKKDGYFEQKATNKAGIVWEVWLDKNKDDTFDEDEKTTVYDSASSAANKAFVIFKSFTSTAELLYIKQGSSKYYGKVQIRATVSAYALDATAPTDGEDTIVVELADKSEFDKALADAKAAVKKTDRYTEAALKALQNVIDAVGLTPGKAAIDTDIKNLNNAVKALENSYKLTGVDFIDDLIDNDVMATIWKVIDFFGTIQEAFNKIGEFIAPASAFFTQVFNAFGFLVPLFTAIGGLIV